jgi:hypothetical protein
MYVYIHVYICVYIYVYIYIYIYIYTIEGLTKEYVTGITDSPYMLYKVVRIVCGLLFTYAFLDGLYFTYGA